MPSGIGRMFRHGEVPRHGLGTRPGEPATLDEAIRHGGLDWSVSLGPLAVGGEPRNAARPPGPRRSAPHALLGAGAWLEERAAVLARESIGG